MTNLTVKSETILYREQDLIRGKIMTTKFIQQAKTFWAVRPLVLRYDTDVSEDHALR